MSVRNCSVIWSARAAAAFWAAASRDRYSTSSMTPLAIARQTVITNAAATADRIRTLAGTRVNQPTIMASQSARNAVSDSRLQHS